MAAFHTFRQVAYMIISHTHTHTHTHTHKELYKARVMGLLYRLMMETDFQGELSNSVKLSMYF